MAKHIYLKELSCLPKMFLDYFLHAKPQSILDFGCGYGFWFYLLQHNNILPPAAIGVENDFELCRVYKNKLPKLNGIYGDVTKINFFDSPFESAICNQVIEHTGDDKAVVKNLYQALKNGGVLYISSIVRKPNARYFYSYKDETRLSCMHVKEYKSLDEFVALLKEGGFRIMQARSTPYYLKWWTTPFGLWRGKIGFRIPGFETVEALCIKIVEGTTYA